MRALTLVQPWADLVAHGGKTTENRTWPTRYRGPLLIHAGTRIDPAAASRTAGLRLPDTRGAVIAAARLTDCHRDRGCCRPWGEPGAWHWTLTGITALPAPVPCRGNRRLWTPPLAVAQAVACRLARGTA